METLLLSNGAFPWLPCNEQQCKRLEMPGSRHRLPQLPGWHKRQKCTDRDEGAALPRRLRCPLLLLTRCVHILIPREVTPTQPGHPPHHSGTIYTVALRRQGNGVRLMAPFRQHGCLQELNSMLSPYADILFNADILFKKGEEVWGYWEYLQRAEVIMLGGRLQLRTGGVPSKSFSPFSGKESKKRKLKPN